MVEKKLKKYTPGCACIGGGVFFEGGVLSSVLYVRVIRYGMKILIRYLGLREPDVKYL